MRARSKYSGGLEKLIVDGVNRSSYCLMSSEGSALLIEDCAIAEEVARRMIEAGVEVEAIHVD
jgi:hypothetical protein